MNKRQLSSYYNNVKKELENKLGEAKNIKATLEDIEHKAGQEVSGIKDLRGQADNILTKINTISENLDSDLQNINFLRKQANDPTTGLEVTIDEINKLKKQADDIKNDLKAYRDTSQSNNNDILKYQISAKKTSESLAVIEEDAHNSLNQIEKFYKLATDTGLAGSFDRRKDELTSSVRRWYWSLMISTGILTLILVAVLIITLKDGIDISYAFSFRVVFISPLIFFIFLSAFQYSKERDLLEKYAFKAVTALALESYTELLTYRFKGKTTDSQILNFVLSAMNTIYKEPYAPNDKSESRLGLKIGPKLGNIESTLNQINEKLPKSEKK